MGEIEQDAGDNPQRCWSISTVIASHTCCRFISSISRSTTSKDGGGEMGRVALRLGDTGEQ